MLDAVQVDSATRVPDNKVAVPFPPRSFDQRTLYRFMLSAAIPVSVTFPVESTDEVLVMAIVGRVESTCRQRIRSACSVTEASLVASSTLELPPPQPTSAKAVKAWVAASTA